MSMRWGSFRSRKSEDLEVRQAQGMAIDGHTAYLFV
jgi:hypothetical protein